ncbi:ABC transporter ATP-binding protein [Pusillimonas sp. ANT_WB101]|uniref:ABC transporter ATP-binding protein n=1 Tax=Pusillimonas sp. ANT_WB101 TaxID=2597356 RepID=UPI00210314A7|nr:ABC transporter ATP-binding protein [Pusillimonas sp. ANT_WB101]
MRLTLEEITRKEGGETWLYAMSLALQPASLTVLLGATRAGKTSLMRIMAGLDAPTSGSVLVDGRNVTGQSVRKRNVAMVYQQFINYPSMTVAQNIASPLKLRGEKNIDEQVLEVARKLHIDMFLDRLPEELSGGQQQRVALARALAKRAPLMLLDEPLVNLDYKLREELRDELGQVFRSGESTVVYATTEPSEALLLGGHTAVLDKGELLQYGPAIEVYQRPKSMRVARAYSDPPMNFFTARRTGEGILLDHGPVLRLSMPLPHVSVIEPALAYASAADGPTTATIAMAEAAATPSTPSTALAASTASTAASVAADVQASFLSVDSHTLYIGLRASSLRTQAREGDITLTGKVLIAEISGSDTFLHMSTEMGDVVAQLSGVRHFEIGTQLPLCFSPSSVFVFDASGDLVLAAREGA